MDTEYEKAIKNELELFDPEKLIFEKTTVKLEPHLEMNKQFEVHYKDTTENDYIIHKNYSNSYKEGKVEKYNENEVNTSKEELMKSEDLNDIQYDDLKTKDEMSEIGEMATEYEKAIKKEPELFDPEEVIFEKTTVKLLPHLEMNKRFEIHHKDSTENDYIIHKNYFNSYKEENVEKYNGIEVNSPKEELIKSEDLIDIQYEDLKTEVEMSEIGESCDMCSKNFIISEKSKKFNIDCSCQNKTKSNVRGENITKDVKLISTPTISEYATSLLFQTPEEMMFKQEKEITIKKPSPDLSSKEFFVEPNDELFSKATTSTQPKNFTEGKLFPCDKCSKTFIDEKKLKAHINIHTAIGSYQCELCLKSFHVESKLKIHARVHTAKKRFKCEICSKSFVCRSKLKAHEKTHTGERPFCCEICLKSFSEKRSLKEHESTHNEDKPFKCETCEKSFVTKRKLTAHKRLHTTENLFNCDICSKLFICKSKLKEHESTHTGVRPFNCEKCPNSFITKSKLKFHERIHTGEKLFNCEVCSKLFICKSKLKEHERTHTGERPYRCGICLKSFFQIGKFKAHERIHNGNAFQCDVCLKSFSTKSILKVHDRIHTGERPFHCEVCFKTFRQKASLDSHKKTHSGEKKFHCGFCSKAFLYKGNLKTHEKIHTKEKLFQCETCQKCFVTNSLLRRHANSHFDKKDI